MSGEALAGGAVELHAGDSRDVLASLREASIDAVVTDPPYGLGFMGKAWDAKDGAAFSPEFWRLVLRVLKPGGHLVAFGGTRTYHRLVCAIEDAGFEIRDQLAWLYGSGFPKSHDVSKGIDKAAGVEFEALPASGAGFMEPDGPGGYNITKNRLRRTGESTDAARQWQGWGTALKPSGEPIVLARKPLIGTVAANVLAHGTGAINVGGCRVPTTDNLNGGAYAKVGGRAESPSLHGGSGMNVPGKTTGRDFEQPEGRWPANVIHDGSDEVVACFPDAPGQAGAVTGREPSMSSRNTFRLYKERAPAAPRGDAGSAARFFYCAKADADDRIGSKHPTIKPVDLMQWLVRLITPPGGVVLDPFAGTGTTGAAALREAFRAVLIEREAAYQADIRRRLALEMAGPDERRREMVKARGEVAADHGPLFGGRGMNRPTLAPWPADGPQPDALRLDRGFWYLATPYSKYAAGLDAAWGAACRIAGRLCVAGVPVFSPIAMTHPIAKIAGLDPLDQDMWLDADEPLMRAAHGLLIADLPGWRESTGVALERRLFASDRKPEVLLPVHPSEWGAP